MGDLARQRALRLHGHPVVPEVFEPLRDEVRSGQRGVHM